MNVFAAALFVAIIAMVIAPTVDLPAATLKAGHAGRLLVALVSTLMALAPYFSFAPNRERLRRNRLAPSLAVHPFGARVRPLIC